MMQKSTPSRYSPARTTRLKTHHTDTHPHSNPTDSSPFLTSRKYYQPPSIDIEVRKDRISQHQGYSSLQVNAISQIQERAPQMQNSKYAVFKNLQEFQMELKTQKGMISKGDGELKAFGITSFRGLRHSINSHQIAAHIGQLTSFTLIEGFEGNFAATQLKKLFTNELNISFRKQQKDSKQEPFRYTEECIKSAFQHTKKQLSIAQNNLGDNSGASFLSHIAYKGISFVANCGSSGALCMTTSGKLLQLATPHTTKNESEVNRIIMHGGQLLQTTVNFPFKKQMGIRGPLRVFPEGLTLTRTVGRSLSNSTKKHRTVSELNTCKKGVLSQLQINYVPSSQIRWVAILSSKIMDKVKSSRIKDLIEQQLSKCSQSYSINEAAEHSAKRIVLEATQLGANESLSCLVLVGSYQQAYSVPATNPKQSWQPTQKAKEQQTTKKLAPQPKSLTYIGKRLNFVQFQHEP